MPQQLAENKVNKLIDETGLPIIKVLESEYHLRYLWLKGGKIVCLYGDGTIEYMDNAWKANS